MKKALNLGIILLYAPRKHAIHITKEVAELYLKIVDDLDEKMEYCLYSVITILADTFFKDEKEYQEVITMIDQKTSAQSKMNLASYEAALEDLKYAKEDITKLECELDKTKNDLTQANGNINKLNRELNKTKNDLTQANGNINKLNRELNKTKNDLTQANENINKLNRELNKTKNDLTQANGQIENRKAEVKKLKQELNSK